MQKTIQNLSEIKLVGITARTNNGHILEPNPATNKIAETVQKYFYEALSEKILQRKKPGTTYCVYTDYESDAAGDFTYFIGEEVSFFDTLPEGFSVLTIPAQKYVKFTNGPGAMPDICINAWQDIWQMTTKELGGERGYLADFEIYDERASDHKSVVFDIYIGIKT